MQVSILRRRDATSSKLFFYGCIHLESEYSSAVSPIYMQLTLAYVGCNVTQHLLQEDEVYVLRPHEFVQRYIQNDIDH